MGEMLMATPALSDGVMYVRSSERLFAIRREQRVKIKDDPAAKEDGRWGYAIR
jgi:hypothetical protein